MKASESLFSILSLAVILAGLLVAAISEWGLLQSQKRIDFYHRVFYSTTAIPGDEECFDDFLKAFPPPPGTASTRVSGIAPRRLTINNTGDDVWSAVRYTINGTTSKTVAIQPDVEKWAYKTAATKIGLLLSFVGFLVGVVKHILTRKTAKEVQQDGVAKKSQPVRSETNSASTTTGSGR